MLKSPYPYFGGKIKISSIVWSRFGSVKNFVEPFFGSGAVLLARDDWRDKTETVNDKNAYIANFWRALKSDPEKVAEYADHPVNETDLHAIHRWLVNRADFRERMITDPDYYDCKVAGWWVWGASCWIGSGWCDYEKNGRGSHQIPELAGERGERRVHQSQQRPQLTCDNGVVALSAKRPHLMSEKGINRQLPWVTGDQGVNRQLPHVSHGSLGEHRANALLGYLEALADRLRRVRVCCGDWSRICTPAVTFGNGLTGVFLDPPYSAEANRDSGLYAEEDLSVAHAVREWCIANGDKRLMRIALCGYDVEHQELERHGWTAVAWKANGGYGNQSDGRGAANAKREIVWFSPHCLGVTLFDLMEDDEANGYHANGHAELRQANTPQSSVAA